MKELENVIYYRGYIKALADVVDYCLKNNKSGMVDVIQLSQAIIKLQKDKRIEILREEKEEVTKFL